MRKNAFEKELLRNFNLLSREQQVRVLAFMRSLPERDQRTSDNKDILKFAGAFDAESLKEMSSAIAENWP